MHSRFTFTSGCFFPSAAGRGDWVLFAVGKTEVGCDIEQMRQCDPVRLGKVVFTEGELDLIKKSCDRLGIFFEI